MGKPAFPEALIPALQRAQSVAALTGAGVSQESGLRTFRDSQTGLWAQHRPEELASPEGFRRNPKLVWDWYAWRREALKGARPNAGHDALANMAKQIPDFSLITQNVDGLHALAGSPDVIELHGNLSRVRCSGCGALADHWDNDEVEQVPVCLKCGGLLRPDVVWFGEALPRSALDAAVAAARRCEIFFSIGTSGVVQPAATLARGAQAHGALLIEVNLEPTPLTESADVFLQGRSGEVLPALVAAVWP